MVVLWSVEKSVDEKWKKKSYFFSLFSIPHDVSVVYTFETFNVYVFYTSTDIFLVLFYNGKKLKVVKTKKNRCAVHLSLQTASTLPCWAGEDRRWRKKEQPFFCHPSWILLRFSRWLCAYMAVHYISGGDGEEKKQVEVYIHIYVGTKQFFLVSVAWLAWAFKTLLSGHLLNHASEMLGYIAFTCTIFGKQLNGNDL